MNSPTHIAPPRRVLFITDFYQEEVLLGVVEHARLAGWELIANMRFHGSFPSETEADGILVTALGDRVRDWMAQWRGVDVVRIGPSPYDLPYASVDVDYARAGAEGARHLLELGHVGHAFYWLERTPEMDSMLPAFQKELAAAGRAAHLLDFPAAHRDRPEGVTREERLRWLAEQLLALPKPLAVMSGDDRRSLELIAACGLAGLRVPDDVAILGCENRNVEVRMSPVPLSSVDMNWKQVGYESARLLDRLMAGEMDAPRAVTVPPRGVVARASTATVVTDSPGVSAALLYIREHFTQVLRTADLARVARLPEREFRVVFKRLVGHGPRTEIQRVRLAAAARLLRDTDLKLDAVASESGFGSAKKLCGVFAETHHTTPTAWRQMMSVGG